MQMLSESIYLSVTGYICVHINECWKSQLNANALIKCQIICSCVSSTLEIKTVTILSYLNTNVMEKLFLDYINIYFEYLSIL